MSSLATHRRIASLRAMRLRTRRRFMLSWVLPAECALSLKTHPKARCGTTLQSSMRWNPSVAPGRQMCAGVHMIWDHHALGNFSDSNQLRIGSMHWRNRVLAHNHISNLRRSSYNPTLARPSTSGRKGGLGSNTDWWNQAPIQMPLANAWLACGLVKNWMCSSQHHAHLCLHSRQCRIDAFQVEH